MYAYYIFISELIEIIKKLSKPKLLMYKLHLLHEQHYVTV